LRRLELVAQQRQERLDVDGRIVPVWQEDSAYPAILEVEPANAPGHTGTTGARHLAASTVRDDEVDLEL
jgi:hypothetical protein